MSTDPIEYSSSPPHATGRARLYLKNTIANGTGFGSRLLVTFFLSPFVVHKLGDSAYGVWVLLVSVTGYMGLLDIGVTTSISRYINLYIAKKEQKQLDGVVSTSLFMCLIAAVILTTLAAVLGNMIGDLFPRIPANLTEQARVILIVLSINVFLGFVAGIFRQLLASRDRFDLINVITITALFCGALGTIGALLLGKGILGLAFAQLLSSALAAVFSFLLAKQYGTPFTVEFSHVTKSTFQEIIHFGIYAFIADVGVQLIYYTNSLVIGSLIGAAAITLYNIPFMLVDYGVAATKQVRAVLAPDLLKAAGRSDPDEMQWLLAKTTRFLMFFAIPLMIGIVFLGRDFISQWMGPKYAGQYPILIVLAISQLGAIAALPCSTLLLGLGRVGVLAACVFAEGIINLGLSITLVAAGNLGLMGIALGVLIPALIFSSFLIPVLACRIAGISFLDYSRRTAGRWLSACSLIVVPYLLIPWLSRFSDWPSFLSRGILFLMLYAPVATATLITKNEHSLIREHFFRGAQLILHTLQRCLSK